LLTRLAYRIQELAYGGLSRETLERLRAMAKQYAGKDAAERKARPVHRPIAGTKLIREWQGVEHCVTVRADDFEYLGRRAVRDVVEIRCGAISGNMKVSFQAARSIG
jgi:hypothetical protein